MKANPKSSAPSVGSFLVNAQPDIPDARDWRYQPSLSRLEPRRDPPGKLLILDQGGEGACTGFGLAAVINRLNQERSCSIQVSPRMLYEMAKLNDEWEGEDDSGSSCRGAIKGWHHTGVCEEGDWPWKENRRGFLTLARAKAARANTIGSYYRLWHRISDFHAALNEVSAIYVAAKVHSGWRKSKVRKGKIVHQPGSIGGHAFAIVGYNENGFWVQNSWGRAWGKNGLALWSYEDWNENIIDAWVLQLALPTPQIWHLPAQPADGQGTLVSADKAPARSEIAGHFVHIDDGKFHQTGRYWSTAQDVQETADLLAQSSDYDHLLFFAHGGLNSVKASARRVLAMKEIFKDNRIYPYHFMYDTGLLEELKDVIFRRAQKNQERVQGLSDASDWILEKLTRIPGRALWREMKLGARAPFKNKDRAGSRVLEFFLSRLAQNQHSIKIHLAGHSAGAVLLAHLIKRLAAIQGAPRVASVNLMAPAATIDLFEQRFQTALVAPSSAFGIDAMQIFNLTDELERDDHVAKVYRKSLLYLVSRAFEETKKMPLLGMQRYRSALGSVPNLRWITSQGPHGGEAQSRSSSHSGFDNNPSTMNSILTSILGQPPARPFTEEDLVR